MTDPNVPPPIRKGRGCFFYGCLTSLVLLLVVFLLALFTVRWIRNEINAYTDTAPMTLPKVEMAEPEFKALEQRMKTFGDAMEQGKPAEPLILTERDLNALLTQKPNMKTLANKVYVSLNGSQVTGQVSIPLDALGWIARGRYLNGEATFHVSLENGVLIVTADELKVKGKPLPETFMKEMRKQNLARDAYQDPKNAEAIGKLESIQVQDSRAIIKARARQ
jgi:hypothetical protein